VPSKITAVTVYPDRARITREADVTVTVGESQVEITGLPTGLDDDSVRISLDGFDGTRLTGIEVRPVEQPRTEADTRAIEEAIEKVEDQRADLSDQRGVLEQRRAFLESLRNNAPALITRTAGTNSTGADLFQSHYALYGTELAAITRTQRDLERQTRTFDRQLEEQRKHLAEVRPVLPPATKKAVVMLQSKTSGAGRVRVSYVTGNASWRPLYDARGTPDSGQVEIGYYANVTQSTGEPWTGVRLALSTARPSVGARLGELEPWHVTFAVPRPVGSTAPASLADAKRESGDIRQSAANSFQFQNNALLQNGNVDALGLKDIAADKPTDATFAVAEVQSLGASAVFEVPARADIPADGRAHRSTIRFLSLTGTAEYVAIPKLQAAAFLKLRTRNASELPLLPGELSVFRGDDFIGKSFLRFVAPGADLDLWLGVDDSLKITRKETKRFEAEGGLLTKTRNVTRAYELEVVNFKGQPVKLTLADQIPVSQSEKLSVTADWQGNTPTKLDKDAGKAEWSLDLKPRDKRVIAYAFEVETPVGSQVEGL
jgi:uncharacterized protein (TIGR02231 family)